MSTLTGLYGGGASGGGGGETHIVTDPKRLPRYGFAQAAVRRASAGTEYSTDDTAFFTSAINASSFGSAVAVTADDTYATLLDITSATNGGYLHWIISPATLSNTDITVKITVDGGTPVELSYQPSAGLTVSSYRRMFVGGGLVEAETTDNITPSSSFLRFNSFYSSGFSSGDLSDLEDATNNVLKSNNVYGQTDPYAYIESSFPDLITLPYHRLFFATSLKIEVKQAFYRAQNASEYAACFYSLI